MDTESLCNEIRKDMEGVGENLLPMDGFPQKFQKLLLDLSYYDGYNLEITAMCLLSALSAAIGNSLWLHIRGNWCTNAALYLLLVGRPGLGKTHPMRFAYGPIYAHDRIRFDQFKKELDEYNRMSGKEKGENQNPKPVLVKTAMSDFTVEAMMKLHSNNPHGVALVIDEFPSMLKRIERSHDDTYEKLLSAWSMQRLLSDRKCEDMPICIDKPCVNMIGGIQTNIIGDCFTPELFNNGFTDRILFVCPKNKKLGAWDSVADDAHSLKEANREQKVWSDMLKPVFDLIGTNAFDAFPVRTLHFDRDAKTYFYDWVNSIIDRNNAIEDDSLVESRDQKLNAQAARLSLLFQVLRWVCGESHLESVDLISVKAAIGLLSYLEEGYAGLVDLVRKAQKQTMNKVNKYAFLDSLPPVFGLKEAEETIGKSTRTVHNYLDHLCNMPEPLLLHTGHNCYEKVQK